VRTGGSRITTKISLLFDQIRWEEKILIQAAKKKRVQMNLIDARTAKIDLTSSKPQLNVEKVALQRCVSYFRGLHLAAALENQGVTVINSHRVMQVCGNKLLSTLALTKAKIPTPKTILAFTPEAVFEALDELGYPAILKPVVGSWGRLLAPLKDKETAEAIIEDREFMHPLYQVYYMQQMVARPPRDIRATVIGDEVVAAIYRVSPPGEWRTNLARGGYAEQCKVTKELEDIALKAAAAVGGGVLGVDMMESPKGLLVHEVNHTIEFKGTYTATGKDIPGMIIDYAVKQVKR